jgi:N-acetylglucosaminyldiphosphoundecaprenol N-acetyl-beta-D-mannosaminyltransferase
MYHTIQLFDLDFISAPSHADVIDDLINYQHLPGYKNKLPFVITPNADQVVKLEQAEHQALKEKLSQSLFIFPDGQPIVWFSKLVRKPLKARLTGSDLFPLFWQRAKQNQQKILIIVSNEILGAKLKQDYENIIYYVPPLITLYTPEFDQVCQTLIEKIQDFQPDYVILGIGFIKQEWIGLFIHQNLKENQIDSPLFLCLGASAEFYVGTRKRAPLWLQKVGLEWLHRLWLEPKRMWRRYILGAFSLLMLYIKGLRKELRNHKKSP